VAAATWLLEIYRVDITFDDYDPVSGRVISHNASTQPGPEDTRSTLATTKPAGKLVEVALGTATVTYLLDSFPLPMLGEHQHGAGRSRWGHSYVLSVSTI